MEGSAKIPGVESSETGEKDCASNTHRGGPPSSHILIDFRVKVRLSSETRGSLFPRPCPRSHPTGNFAHTDIQAAHGRLRSRGKDRLSDSSRRATARFVAGSGQLP